MIFPQRDPYRWRRRFAWRPRKIATQWIWLEWYARRLLKSEEVAPLLSDLYAIGPLRLSWWEEFTIRRTGYTVWRETAMPLAMCPPTHYWHRPPLKLKIVGANR